MSKRGQKNSTNYVKYKHRTREEVPGQTWERTGAGQTGVTATGLVQDIRGGPRKDKMPQCIIVQANTVSEGSENIEKIPHTGHKASPDRCG